MHRLSNPPKGPRGASPSLRPNGGARGGIQKRGRTASPRVDRDGDLILDANAAKTRVGKGRLNSPSLADRTSSSTSIRGTASRAGSRLSSSRAQAAIIRGLGGEQANIRNGSRKNHRQSASLQVRGLAQSRAASNADGGLKGLVEWIHRKAGPKSAKKDGVRITKSRITGDSTVIITAAPEDIITIRMLDGFEFAGATLSFKAEGPTAEEVLGQDGGQQEEVSSGTQEVKERLKAILAQRYNPEMKLLNLSGLANDNGLREMGMFDGTTTPSKIFPALMAICDSLFKTRKEKLEAVESVSLTDNGLATVKDVLSLATTFADLKNLDLSNNALSNVSSLDGWKHKFRGLVNLVLTGNPIEQQLAVVSDELLRQFPNLQIINNVQLRTSDDIAAAKEALKNVPLPFPIGPADFRDTSQVGESFIRTFIPLYDTNRQTLLNTYYDGDSRVSISVNMNAPRDKTLGGGIPRWEKYTKHSRNLTRVTHLPTRMSRQYCGTAKIQELWQDLPITRHPDLATEPQKYTIECNPIPGLVDPTGASPAGVDGLMLSIHGEFEEPNPTPEKSNEKAMRSFVRTFIIGPGASQQQPIRVISDMLTLRPWTPLAVPIVVSPPPIDPLASQTQLPGMALGGASEEQIQHAMAQELMIKTGMTLEFAVLCLKETGWNLEQALAAFVANRDKLPPNAFATQ